MAQSQPNTKTCECCAHRVQFSKVPVGTQFVVKTDRCSHGIKPNGRMLACDIARRDCKGTNWAPVPNSAAAMPNNGLVSSGMTFKGAPVFQNAQQQTQLPAGQQGWQQQFPDPSVSAAYVHPSPMEPYINAAGLDRIHYNCSQGQAAYRPGEGAMFADGQGNYNAIILSVADDECATFNTRSIIHKKLIELTFVLPGHPPGMHMHEVPVGLLPITFRDALAWFRNKHPNHVV